GLVDLEGGGGVDGVDGPELTVRNAALAIRRGHLHAVSRCERAIGILIERYTVKPTRVIAESAVVVRSDGHLVRLRVHAFDARVVARLDAERLAAAAVPKDVALLVTAPQ